MQPEILRELKDFDKRIAKLESYDRQSPGYGSAFPTDNVYTGRKFFNTTYNEDFFWNGSAWLTATRFHLSGFITPGKPYPLTANDIDYLLMENRQTGETGYTSLYVEKINIQTYILTTNDNTKYWTITYYRVAQSGAVKTSLGTVTTQSKAASTFLDNILTLNTSYTKANAAYFTVDFTKTSTPGNLYAIQGIVLCRGVGT